MINTGYSEVAAQREGQKQGFAQWNERISELAAQGVKHAQESVAHLDAQQPDAAELALMREDPGAFSAEHIARWSHLLKGDR